MIIRSKLSVTLLCTASIVALSSVARAQDNTPASVETVVVTGSLVITNAANSPTPLTEVSTAQLLETTPTNIPEALEKLPIFQGSGSISGSAGAGGSGGHTINLRNFGATRVLTLFDGHRAPSNDIDTLPELLTSRVDVVTGGASAVYGSDAVTGVVNFVIDKHFNGIKYNIDSGISNYGDAASYKAEMAAGIDLFGGRGHIEVDLRHSHIDRTAFDSRPWAAKNWTITGNGTAANPYINTDNSTLELFSFGGKISCTGCSANGMQFIQNGVVGPFYNGKATGSASVFQGGDGAYTTFATNTQAQTLDHVFSRFSYNLDDSTTFYVQGEAAQNFVFSDYQSAYMQPGAAPNTFFANNAFLSPVAQAALASKSGIFTMTEYFNEPWAGATARDLTTNYFVTAGVDGTIMDKYDWRLYYTHGYSRVRSDDPTNQSAEKMYAAEDAVLTSGGQVQCYVSTTTYASLYPGCVPMNPFGPTALTQAQYKYFNEDTAELIPNPLDDVGGSVAGDIFDLPAGPVRAALSGEARWLSYGVISTNPTHFVDCTGLRNCNTAAVGTLYTSFANQPTESESVWEFASEATVPVLKDVPLVQELTADIAGRYTDYSTSGAVETWKLGMDWHVNDDMRFRGTTSVDIRAPTLADLYAPQTYGHQGIQDIHTGDLSGSVLSTSQGNINLVPEVARTYTAGVVLTPSFIPGLTTSLDYYNITIKNAITNIGPGVGSNSENVQNFCEQSHGTSPFCSLIVRPLPFSDTTPANFPTLLITENLNVAINQVEGWDFEADYAFEMSDIMDDLPGSVNLRLLANNQPVNVSEQYVGAPLTQTAVPKTRVTTYLGYNLGNWTFNVQDRWNSNFLLSSQPGIVFYTQPRGKPLNLIDVTANRKFELAGMSVEGYFSVQDIFNTPPPVEPSNATTVGLHPNNSPDPTGLDYLGRYFTIGLRGDF